MREYITNNDERINLKQLEDIMKIKEQIKTIIEDYSEARDISAEYTNTMASSRATNHPKPYGTL